MELIQIIYSILIYGGASLIVVLAFSFTLSKTRSSNLNQLKAQKLVSAPQYLDNLQYSFQNNITSNSSSQRLNQSEQTKLRKFSSQPQPQIFQIDQINQRELKIIRKPTFHTATDVTKELLNETQKSSLRYTVVNEKMNKPESRVMNFYL